MTGTGIIAIIPGDELESPYEKDKGTYFGKLDNGKDWCLGKSLINGFTMNSIGKANV